MYTYLDHNKKPKSTPRLDHRAHFIVFTPKSPYGFPIALQYVWTPDSIGQMRFHNSRAFVVAPILMMHVFCSFRVFHLSWIFIRLDKGGPLHCWPDCCRAHFHSGICVFFSYSTWVDSVRWANDLDKVLSLVSRFWIIFVQRRSTPHMKNVVNSRVIWRCFDILFTNHALVRSYYDANLPHNHSIKC